VAHKKRPPPSFSSSGGGGKRECTSCSIEVEINPLNRCDQRSWRYIQ
jgi:hypothetical protein